MLNKIEQIKNDLNLNNSQLSDLMCYREYTKPIDGFWKFDFDQYVIDHEYNNIYMTLCLLRFYELQLTYDYFGFAFHNISNDELENYLDENY